MNVTTEHSARKRSDRRNLILGICCMSLPLVSMDVTIVNVALPAIQHELHATLSGLPWILDAYTLVVASLLMLAGSVAERATPIALLLLVYMLFGIGLGMVNPAIANSAVEGMPRSQAGVAAAIASTSRQVGAALGVAVAGTVVSTSHAHGSDFTQATHAIWWIMVACSASILLLGWASNTPWAHSSVRGVAHLLEDQRRG